MDEAHLTLEALARLLSGGMTYEELREQVIPHLLERCPVCRESHQEILRLQEDLGHWNEEVVVIEGLEAPALWDRLSRLSYEQQVRKVEEDSELQTWGFCQNLLKRSLEAGFVEPSIAVNLANLAVKISLRLGDVYHPEWVQDIRGRALAYLGNARRVYGELRSADDAFRLAESYLEQGTGSPSLKAEILDLQSSLRRAQRQLSDALRLLNQALALYRGGRESLKVGKALLQKAKILQEMGNFGRAISLLKRRADEIKATGDPNLFAYARFNLLTCLTDAHRYEEAKKLLPEVHQIFSADQCLNLSRIRWAEANIYFGMNQIPEAEAAFLEVQSSFLERGMSYDAALVSLELSLVYLREEKISELKQLAGNLVLLFESRDVHREALGALYLFQKACEEERLTEQTVSRLAQVLRNGRPAREA